MHSKNIWDTLGTVIEGVGILIGLFALLSGLLTWYLVWRAGRFLLRKYRESRNIVENWPRTQATVKEVTVSTLKLGEDTVQRNLAVYTFTDPFGQAHEAIDDAGALRDPRPGMSLEVTYDPNDPSTSHPTTGIKGRVAWWAAACVLVLGALAGLGALLVYMGIDTLTGP